MQYTNYSLYAFSQPVDVGLVTGLALVPHPFSILIYAILPPNTVLNIIHGCKFTSFDKYLFCDFSGQI